MLNEIDVLEHVDELVEIDEVWIDDVHDGAIIDVDETVEIEQMVDK